MRQRRNAPPQASILIGVRVITDLVPSLNGQSSGDRSDYGRWQLWASALSGQSCTVRPGDLPAAGLPLAFLHPGAEINPEREIRLTPRTRWPLFAAFLLSCSLGDLVATCGPAVASCGAMVPWVPLRVLAVGVASIPRCGAPPCRTRGVILRRGILSASCCAVFLRSIVPGRTGPPAPLGGFMDVGCSRPSRSGRVFAVGVAGRVVWGRVRTTRRQPPLVRKPPKPWRMGSWSGPKQIGPVPQESRSVIPLPGPTPPGLGGATGGPRRFPSDSPPSRDRRRPAPIRLLTRRALRSSTFTPLMCHVSDLAPREGGNA
jgi:hypothetical protein